jgi:hypothetical protein
VIKTLAVQRQSDIRVRKELWVIAAVFFIVFCWLGFAAARFGSLFQGFEEFEQMLPITSRFVYEYGTIAFPLFGVAAGATFILSDVLFRNGWVKWVLVGVFVLFILCAFNAMVISGVWMESAINAP